MNLMKHPRLLAATAAIGLIALLGWAFAPRPVAVEVARADLGPFETTIDEDARTRLRDRFVVCAPLTGRLLRPTLREGDPVAKGAVVARLLPMASPLQDDRTLLELQARLGAAQAGLERATAQVGLAQIGRDNAELALQRSEPLARQGYLAASRLDDDRLALQSAAKALDGAVQAENAARSEMDAARAALQATHTGSAGAGVVVRSPVAGRVLKIHQTSEALLVGGAPIVDIGDTAELEVVAELLSSDALLAHPDSLVRIDRWGGPTVLQGRVRRVESAAFTKVSALGVEEQRVNVLIDIVSPREHWAQLGDGYRVGVRVVTRSQPKVLRVPVSAVFPPPLARTGAGDPVASAGVDASSGSAGPQDAAVFVLAQGRAHLRRIRLVARNSSHAWVEQGVSDGEQLVVYPSAAVADGVSVVARDVTR
jgi:HlyD family secretion protein